MSSIATAVAWNASIEHAPTKMILLALASVADDQHVAALSREQLMRLTELSETTVRQSLQRLVNQGLIEEAGNVIRKDPSGDDRLVPQYRIAIAATFADMLKGTVE